MFVARNYQSTTPMTNFGAGFALLSLLLVLGGLAAVALLAGAVALGYRRYTGESPPEAGRYPLVLLLVAAVGVAGFGIVALVDEAPIGSGLLLAGVAVPLVASVATLRWRNGRSWPSVGAIATVAWSAGYLLGLAAFAGIVATVPAALDIPQGSARTANVAWVAVGVTGVVATVVAVEIARRWPADGDVAGG